MRAPHKPINALLSCALGIAIALCTSSTSAETNAYSWGAPEQLQVSVHQSTDPQVVIDGQGRATVAWVKLDDAPGWFPPISIWASRFVPGAGWSTPTLLETASGDASWQKLAVDVNGNVTAVWRQWDGSRVSVYANFMEAQSGQWSGAQLIETDNTGDAESPQIALDGHGNAVVVWQRGQGLQTNVWAVRRVAGVWQGAVEIDNTSSNALRPVVAVDRVGNAVVLWTQHMPNMHSGIAGTRYTNASGWGTPTLLPSIGQNYGDKADVAMDASGVARAVWIDYDGTRYNGISSRYVAGAGWQVAELFENSSLPIDTPRIAARAGKTIVVWAEGPSSSDDIWANEPVSGSGWGTAARLESGSNPAGLPRIAIDAVGNAVAVWHQGSGSELRIHASRYAGGVWDKSAPISPPGGVAGTPKVALDGNGRGFAVWAHSIGDSYDINAASFTP